MKKQKAGAHARAVVSAFCLLPSAFLVAAVRTYQWTLSPALAFVFGPMARCRFNPSCSRYALDCIQRHGAMAGSFLALKRIARCHPWGGCGDDPAPATKIRISDFGFHIQSTKRDACCPLGEITPHPLANGTRST